MMRVKKYNIQLMAACVLCAGLALPLHAQQEVVYTVEQCRQMALEHNAKIKNAKNNIAGSEETSKDAHTNYYPKVSANVNGFAADKGSLKMVLGPGMEMSLLKKGVTAGVTAVQPVYTGGQIRNGNKLAKVGVDVSRLQLEQAQNEVQVTAEQYFWQVVTLQENLKTVNAVDTMLQALDKDVQMAVKAGLVMRNDLLQIQLKRNEIASTRIKLSNGIAVSKMLLAQYIGADSTAFTLSAAIPEKGLPAAPDELYRRPDASLLLTPEYRLLQKNIEANVLQQKLTAGKQLPTVGIGASYMYHNILDTDRAFGMVFATVSVLISDWWSGKHAIKQKQLQVINARNDLEDKSQLLMIRMQKAWDDVTDAYKQLAIARKSIEQSEENLRLNNQYYKVGPTKMSDLLNAQTMYQQSCDKFVDAYSAYRLKIVEYLKATGR